MSNDRGEAGSWRSKAPFFPTDRVRIPQPLSPAIRQHLAGSGIETRN
jgi:hypothetical protein